MSINCKKLKTMKITVNILTATGAKEAESEIKQEIQQNFATPIRCYQAASNIEKVAKSVKKSFITKDWLKQLADKHQADVDAHRSFVEEGQRCLIQKKLVYTFKHDKERSEILAKIEKAEIVLKEAQADLNAREAKLAKMKSKVEKVDAELTFKCLGEDKLTTK